MVLELFLVSDDFYGNLLVSFVIKAFDGLTKGALAKELEDLIPKGEVILKDHLIISLVIIVSMIEDIHLFQTLLMSLDVFWRLLCSSDHMSLDLSFAILSKIVNLFIKF